MSTPTNQHGRKWGRGLRPWLLIPKVLCVAAGFGATLAAAACLLCVGAGDTHDQIVTMATLGLVLLDWIVCPSLVIAAALGVWLLVTHGFHLLRMRWLALKLIVIIGLMPWPMLGGRSQMLWLIETDPMCNSAYPAGGVRLGLVNLGGAVLLWIAIIWLGRHKPRLGQNIATVYQKRKMKEQITS